jgi:citronellol/citronellal dehydrogenase
MRAGDMQFDGNVAMVLGASAGIGRAYAWALAGAGATVVAAARTLGTADGTQANSLANVVKGGSGLAGRVFAEVCDVESESDIAATIDQTVANFGRLDILVCNAALMTTFDPLDVPADAWDRMMRINVRAPYLAMRHAAPHMQRQGGGSIVNITAKAGDMRDWQDTVGLGYIVYATTKAALNRLTVYMATELRPFGIAVNALSPGVVATDTALAATPNLRDYGGKEASAEVLGPALLHLAAQTAEGVTGQILYTDLFGKTWP